MFVTSSQYEQVVRTIFEEEKELLVAVAFWGRGAECIISPHFGQSIKLICNLKSGATNPSVIECMRNKQGVVLRQHDKLHAKVVVGCNSALVGSANFSGNGLNFEGGEIVGWEEAGILVQDIHQIDAIRSWFNNLWTESRKIEESDLEEARARWEDRRATRLKSSHSFSLGFSLGELNRLDISDRRIFVAIYGSFISEEAKKAYLNYETRLVGQKQINVDYSNLPPIYENWNDLPKDAYIIDLYYGPRGALRCYGVFKRTHDIDFKYHDGTSGHLAVCKKENNIFGMKFGLKEASQFANDLKIHIKNILNSELSIGDDDGKYIRLVDILDIIN